MRGRKRRPLLVAIVGGSGSGKSWLADHLQSLLGAQAVRLSLDEFYLDRSHLPLKRRARLNYDHPRVIDWQCLETTLKRLIQNRAVRVPQYDFKTHSRMDETRLLKPSLILIMDGLWLLRRPAVRRLFDFSVFRECPRALRLKRRLKRDRLSRGRTASSVEDQFNSTVDPMHCRFVAPQARLATVVLPAECGRKDIRRLADIILSKIHNQPA